MLSTRSAYQGIKTRSQITSKPKGKQNKNQQAALLGGITNTKEAYYSTRHDNRKLNKGL